MRNFGKLSRSDFVQYTSARVCEKYGITYNEKNCSSTSLSEWVAKYRAVGPEAFTHSYHNKSCSSELKTQAVEEYLSYLRVMIRKGRSIWQRRKEKQHSRNARK